MDFQLQQLIQQLLQAYAPAMQGLASQLGGVSGFAGAPGMGVNHQWGPAPQPVPPTVHQWQPVSGPGAPQQSQQFPPLNNVHLRQMTAPPMQNPNVHQWSRT